MKKTVLFLLLFVQLATAQKPYFQQEVNTKIEVTLDDEKHRLAGRIEIEYINRSPDELTEIWMHCWPNAYKSRRSAMSKQFLRLGSGKFYFSPDTLLGGLRGLDFAVDGQKCAWRFDEKHPDVVLLILPKPLSPSGKITITTPLNLKIPNSFSRLGHVGQSYQMTQWFIKPAVYDHKGWHPMPYLNMGEFYSEFGRYEVSITLPENYVVGATGVLQNPEEIEFLNKKVAETRDLIEKKAIELKNVSFPESAEKMKTIRFVAENVHDFAWFADKRFLVVRDTARLASGRTVDCWAMFTNDGGEDWPKGAFYVRRAVEYYSERVGEYPYPHATAVLSALSAGGGMEYPMITVINDKKGAKGIDNVITHEVGHNWFYGLLASNERDHPWMDEGMNSYYEGAYMKKYYGGDVMDEAIPKRLIDKHKHGSISQIGNQFYARQGLDIPCDSHSDKFESGGYGLLVYKKTELVMGWLEASVGTPKFDAAMQAYFKKWKFRHPYPEDFATSLHENGLDPTWFLQQMQTRLHTDYFLKKVKKTGDGNYTLTLKNRGQTIKNEGQSIAPFVVAALRDTQVLAEKWYPGFTGKTEVRFPAADGADRFVIDNEQVMLDVNRKNNFRKVSGGVFGEGRPLQVKMLAPLENPHRRTLGLLPWIGWNDYDKTQLGLLFYNPPVPGQRLQFYVAPGYGLGSKGLTGVADLKYRFYPGGVLPRVTVGLSGKNFRYEHNEQHDYFLKMSRIVPSLQLDLADGSTSFRHWVLGRAFFVNRQFADFDTTAFQGVKDRQSTIYELKYEGMERRLPNPYQFSVGLEQQNFKDPFDREGSYLRATATWKQDIFYKNKRRVSARLFAGFFAKNTAKNSPQYGFGEQGYRSQGALSMSRSGYTDYLFDHTFFGRSAGASFLARQTVESEGGFKYGFGPEHRATAGHSNNYLLAANLTADLPQKLPLLGSLVKPYFDIGYAGLGEGEGELFWSGGFAVQLLRDYLYFYFPVVNSQNLNDLYKQNGNYASRISWRINLKDLEPIGLVDRFLR